MSKAFRYQHLRSLVPDTVPSAEQLREGEIAVNLAAGKEKMFLKNTSGQVITFITEQQVEAKIESGSSIPITEKINELSGDVSVNTADIVNLKSQTSALESSKFGGVSYDSDSKKINFYDSSSDGNLLGYIDATEFIKDGMVDNVEIKTISGKSYLVITFNTDSGKQPISIPVSDFFDASNYYTKGEVDGKLTLKLNVSVYENDMSSVNNRLTSVEEKVTDLKNGIECGEY